MKVQLDTNVYFPRFFEANLLYRREEKTITVQYVRKHTQS
jgi:hypothetical protein